MGDGGGNMSNTNNSNNFKWLMGAAVTVTVMIMAVGITPSYSSSSSSGSGGLDCGSVVSYLKPCVPYLGGGGGSVGGKCCAGAKALYAAAKTTKDRQTVCRCVVSAAGPANIARAAAIPSQCGIHIPYKITSSTDCSKVK
ncbi:non-specific lipid-transfer protein 1-like [Andrographis paniculata]|uniref:non-specific lipid-transfer protein 1-like n=1 Tax=Andrographis paniculata TaxID=175694 RepID=UPI0021E922E8|nr:non-specific lipid-transfer protein 1-like [Andrographis paniculata]